MKDAILLELANRWDADARHPQAEDGSEEARLGNAVRKGMREAKRECADALRSLVSLIGDN